MFFELISYVTILKNGLFTKLNLRKSRATSRAKVLAFYKGGQRYFSSNSSNSKSRDFENKLIELKIDNKFLEWFRGFTDGEGSFSIEKSGLNNFIFKFSIHLHMGDIRALEYIKEMLGIGNIYISKNKDKVKFVVHKQKDIQFIIDIFSNYSLNTIKHLNFIDFKKAFELYSNSKQKIHVLDQITNIQNGINFKRTNFKNNNPFKITPYWLLGFIEGEGSFYVTKQHLLPCFSLGQSNKDSLLMSGIREYLNNLANGGDKVTEKENSSSEMIYLAVNQAEFIDKYLIPFLDNLTWQTKKEKDFKDWKNIIELKGLGLHYTDEGSNVINQILNQMNNYRLSTNSTLKIDRVLLLKKIDELLKGPSNIEEKNGKLFIKSLNRYLNKNSKQKINLLDEDNNILNTFDSQKDCSVFLEVSPMTVSNYLKKNKSFSWKNKTVYLKKNLNWVLYYFSS